MDTCKKCQNELDFWQVLKSFWLNFRSIKCFFCGAVQLHAERNRILGAIVALLTFLFTARLLFIEDLTMATFLGYMAITLFTGLLFSAGAVPFLKFNILQTQRFHNKKNN